LGVFRFASERGVFGSGVCSAIRKPWFSWPFFIHHFLSLFLFYFFQYQCCAHPPPPPPPIVIHTTKLHREKKKRKNKKKNRRNHSRSFAMLPSSPCSPTVDPQSFRQLLRAAAGPTDADVAPGTGRRHGQSGLSHGANGAHSHHPGSQGHVGSRSPERRVPWDTRGRVVQEQPRDSGRCNTCTCLFCLYVCLFVCSFVFV
jgi:hypothetical protein